MRKAQAYLLSDHDIRKIMMTPPPPRGSSPLHMSQIRLVTYDELDSVQSLEEVFRYGQSPIVMLLYVHSRKQFDTSGHWSLLLWRNHGFEIEFFDSYGQLPDDMLFNIDKRVRKELGQDQSHLLCLLSEYLQRNPQRRVVSSSVPLQRDKKGINTCGRYVGFRARNHGLPLTAFEEWLDDYRRSLGRGVSYDDAIVLLTERYLPPMRS